MTPKNSHKIIAAGGMVAVIAIAATTFAMRSGPTTPVAPAFPPTATVADTPAVAAETPFPALVAEAPAPAATVTPDASVAPNDAQPAAPAPARKRALATDNRDAVIPNRAAMRSDIAVASSDKVAPVVVVDTSDRLMSGDVLTMPALAGSPAVDAPKAGATDEGAATDSRITTDVKSAIAGDSLGKDSSIGVTTTHGAVVLTGTAPTQSAIDQVKDVAGKVKDVKSVDASALILASL